MAIEVHGQTDYQSPVLAHQYYSPTECGLCSRLELPVKCALWSVLLRIADHKHRYGVLMDQMVRKLSGLQLAECGRLKKSV